MSDEDTKFPCDLAEEKDALGACLLGRAAEAAKVLSVDCFSTLSHREIFSAICAIVDAGEGGSALEISQLATELRSRGKLALVGGVAYVADLTTLVVRGRPMESRARILQGYAERRRLLKISVEIEKRALDMTQPVEKALTWLQGETR